MRDSPGRGETVVIGLSGGVDSAVAANLLVRQGYTVIGATMRVWSGASGEAGARHSCFGPDEAEDVADARRVAAGLGVPLHELDLVTEYRDHVLDYFRDEYALGRTPNPCVRCNQHLKFGFVLKRLTAAGVAFDRFATGHYARVRSDVERGRHVLMRGVDRRKDQSYFLSRLDQEQLERAMFPLGGMLKSRVREIARDLGVAVADKAESQDFASEGYMALLGDPGRPGPIRDHSGRELGAHRGIGYFTVGQRKGLGIAVGHPLYVVAIDRERDTVVVGRQEEAMTATLSASEPNWIACDPSSVPGSLEARIRHNHLPAPASVLEASNDRLELRFDTPQFAVAPGQTVVCYQGEDVVVSAIID